MSVTALPLSQPDRPESVIDADENGVRIFFPTDNYDYSLSEIGMTLAGLWPQFPDVTLDYTEAVEGGILFDFMYPDELA